MRVKVGLKPKKGKIPFLPDGVDIIPLRSRSERTGVIWLLSREHIVTGSLHKGGSGWEAGPLIQD